MNFDGFISYLLTEKRSSPHTLEAYKGDLEQFAAFLSRTFQIDQENEVVGTMVRSWVAELMEEGYKATSVHRKISSVNAFYRFRLKKGLGQVNPTKGITKPKASKRLPTFVEERGMKHIYDSSSAVDFTSARNELMVSLFYETGIRLSELMQIEDKDVDTYQKQIKVLGKRNKMRFVPVSQNILDKINHYQRFRDLHDPPPSDPHLFISEKGKKISKSFVYQTVKSYLSGITTAQKKSPHVLRHSFATHMLNNGADLNVIKEILGHSSLAATQVYTHNSIEKLKGIHAQKHPRNK